MYQPYPRVTPAPPGRSRRPSTCDLHLSHAFKCFDATLYQAGTLGIVAELVNERLDTQEMTTWMRTPFRLLGQCSTVTAESHLGEYDTKLASGCWGLPVIGTETVGPQYELWGC